jgi:hypothetical protein
VQLQLNLSIYYGRRRGGGHKNIISQFRVTEVPAAETVSRINKSEPALRCARGIY